MASSTTTAASKAVEASEGGLPQLDFSTFGNQIFWLLVTLIVIYLILSKLALPRIAAVLVERQGTISHDVAMAEELKEKAVSAEAAYNKALNDARSEAARIVEATKAEIKAELDRQMSEVIEIPCIIDGKEVFTGNIATQVIPHNHSHIIARVHLAGKDEMENACKAAVNAQQNWIDIG